MSWIKFVLTAVSSYFLIVAVQAEELPVTVPLYEQCPLSLQLDSGTYPLSYSQIYLGPIENQAVLRGKLVAEDYENESSFWLYETCPEFPFYLKCHYQDTWHYLVLPLHGARRCTQSSTGADGRVKCE